MKINQSETFKQLQTLTQSLYSDGKWMQIKDSQSAENYVLAGLSTAIFETIHLAFQKHQIRCESVQNKFLKLPKLQCIDKEALAQLMDDINYPLHFLITHHHENTDLTNAFLDEADRIGILDRIMTSPQTENYKNIKPLELSIELDKPDIFEMLLNKATIFNLGDLITLIGDLSKVGKISEPEQYANTLLGRIEKYGYNTLQQAKESLVDHEYTPIKKLDNALLFLGSAIKNWCLMTNQIKDNSEYSIELNLRQSKNSFIKYTHIFFKFLDNRYPSVDIQVSRNKRERSKMLLTLKAKNSALCDAPDVERMQNDALMGFFEVVTGCIPILYNKNKNIKITCPTDFPMIKKKLGQKLVDLVDNDDCHDIKRFFIYHDWNVEWGLPVNNNLAIIPYCAQQGATESGAFLSSSIKFDKQQCIDTIRLCSKLWLLNKEKHTVKALKTTRMAFDLMNQLKQNAEEIRSELPKLLEKITDRLVDTIVDIRSGTIDYEKQDLNFQYVYENMHIPEMSRSTFTHHYEAELNELRGYCQANHLPNNWMLTEIIKNSRKTFTLISNDSKKLGLMSCLFQEQELFLDFQKRPDNLWLTIRAMPLVWPKKSEQQCYNPDDFKRVFAFEQVLDKILLVTHGIINTSDWKSDGTRFYCDFRAKKNKETPEQYQTKIHNALLMLNLIFEQCGIKLDTPNTTLELTFEQLKQPELLMLLNADKAAYKYCNHAAHVISKCTTKLHNTTELISEVEKYDSTQAQIKSKESNSTSKITTKQIPERRLVSAVPKKKATRKPRQNIHKPHKAKKVAAPPKLESSNQSPTKTSHYSGPSIAPQDPDRYKALNDIGTLPYTYVGESSNPLDFTQKPKRSIKNSNNNPPSQSIVRICDQRLSSDASHIRQLRQRVEELNHIVKPYLTYIETLETGKPLTQRQQLQIMTYIASWHYCHSQICNILARLQDDKHLALTQIFTHDIYRGRTLHDRHKHSHFPPIISKSIQSESYKSIGENCFTSIDNFIDAFDFIQQGAQPTEQTQAILKQITNNWATYIQSQFEHYGIIELCKDKTIDEFGQWVTRKNQEYTDRIRQLVSEYEDSNEPLVIEMAIKFYVTRIGELAGHIPLKHCDEYLKFCRRYRNAAAHCYENIEQFIEEQDFSVQKLAAVLPKKKAIDFFNSNQSNRPWTFHVNKDYSYTSDEINMLLQQRINQSLAKSATKTPVIVCEEINLTPRTNLYSLLSKQIKSLEQTMLHRGLIVLPVHCSLDNNQATKSSQPSELCAVTLTFERQKNTVTLNEICYSTVVDCNEIAQSCFENISKNWSLNCPEKNTPTCCEQLSTKLDPTQTAHASIYLIELMHLLVERRLLIDDSLTNEQIAKLPHRISPENNHSDNTSQHRILKNIRQAHIKLAWESGHLDFYFRQQLIKPSRSNQETTLAKNEPGDIEYRQHNQ